MKKILRKKSLKQQIKKSKHIETKTIKKSTTNEKINQLTKTRLQNQSINWNQMRHFNKGNKETKTDEKEEQQMNNGENIKELQTQPADKEQ